MESKKIATEKDKFILKHLCKSNKYPNFVICFTDGAAPDNGRNVETHFAGIGVYFPHDTRWNISEPLDESISTFQGEKCQNKTNQTNATAEVEAVYRAIKLAVSKGVKKLL